MADEKRAAADEQPANSPAAISEGEAKIRAALAMPTSLEFIETPLADVLEFLEQAHDIPIEISLRALNDVGISTDVPITRNLSGLSLRTALRLMLRDLGLTYMIDDEVLTITTPEEAQGHAATRVYDVSKLLPLSADDASELAELVQQMVPLPPSPPHDPAQPPPSRQRRPLAVTSYHFLLVVRATEETHYEIEQLLAGLEAGLTSAAREATRGLPAAPKSPPAADPFGAPTAPKSPPATDPFGGGDPFGAGVDPFGGTPKRP